MARTTSRRRSSRTEEPVDGQVMESQAEVGIGFETAIIAFTTIFLLAAVIMVLMMMGQHYGEGPFA